LLHNTLYTSYICTCLAKSILWWCDLFSTSKFVFATN